MEAKVFFINVTCTWYRERKAAVHAATKEVKDFEKEPRRE